MGFLVNGIALDQPTKGWVVSERSKVMPSIARRVHSLTRPGRDGLIRVPSDFDAGSFTLVVNSPRANVEPLAALLSSPNAVLTDSARAGKQALLDLVSIDYPRIAPSDRVVAVTALYRLTEGFWRDVTDSTTASVSLASGSGSVMPWVGMSAPVGDALILVRGPATKITAVDSLTGFGYEWSGTLPSTDSIVFDMDSQQARQTVGNSFGSGTDRTSGLVMIGDRMKLWPVIDSGTLATSAKVDITLVGHDAGSLAQVKGRACYAV